MITKYFSQIVVRFKPTSKGAKTARMFLASIPPKSRGEMKLSHKVLAPSSTDAEEIKVTYKDGKTISVDPSTVGGTNDMQQAFDQYSRSLRIKEEINDT